MAQNDPCPAIADTRWLRNVANRSPEFPPTASNAAGARRG